MVDNSKTRQRRTATVRFRFNSRRFLFFLFFNSFKYENNKFFEIGINDPFTQRHPKKRSKIQSLTMDHFDYGKARPNESAELFILFSFIGRWIDSILQVVRRDLDAVTLQFQDKHKQLRQERVNLINAKVKMFLFKPNDKKKELLWNLGRLMFSIIRCSFSKRTGPYSVPKYSSNGSSFLLSIRGFFFSFFFSVSLTINATSYHLFLLDLLPRSSFVSSLVCLFFFWQNSVVVSIPKAKTKTKDDREPSAVGPTLSPAPSPKPRPFFP